MSRSTGWTAAGVAALALLAGGAFAGCTFDSAGLATKNACTADGDCLSGLVCACGACAAPAEAAARCGDADTDNADTPSPEDSGRVESDEDANRPDAPQDTSSGLTDAEEDDATSPDDAGDDASPDDAGEDTPDDATDSDASPDSDDAAPDGDDASPDDDASAPEDASVPCSGAPPNACGGCETLEAAPDAPCGPCGRGVWRCDTSDALTCDDPTPTNSCGGCALLDPPPGEACGACGTGVTVCDGDAATVCTGGDLNVCGGCAPLGAFPGDGCGCGAEQLTCDTADSLRCADSLGPQGAPINLGNRSPNDDWGQTTGRIHDARDEDWYRFGAEERLVAAIEPDIELITSADLALCAYYRFNNASIQRVVSCAQGGASTWSGLHGCCSDLPGDERVELRNIEEVGDDAGEVILRVYSPAGASSCEDYRLRFRL